MRPPAPPAVAAAATPSRERLYRRPSKLIKEVEAEEEEENTGTESAPGSVRDKQAWLSRAFQKPGSAKPGSVRREEGGGGDAKSSSAAPAPAEMAKAAEKRDVVTGEAPRDDAGAEEGTAGDERPVDAVDGDGRGGEAMSVATRAAWLKGAFR